MLKHLLLLLLVGGLMCTGISVATAGPAKATASTTADGDWDTGGDWDNGAPDESKDDITIDTDMSSGAGLDFANGASLTVTAGNTLTINGNSQFSNGSVIVVEATAILIINGDLNNANNSNGVTIDGTLTVNGDFTGGTGSTIEGDGEMSAESITTSGSGTTFGSSDDCTGGCVADETGGVLPVELGVFAVDTFDYGNLLTWTTLSEKNNDYFSIEYSSDGEVFIELTTVPGSGTSSEEQEYEYMDYAYRDGYYKLSQVDFDGTRAELQVLYVQGRKVEAAFKVFPNPSTDGSFNVKTKVHDAPVLIVVRDVHGKEVYHTTVVTNAEGVASVDRAGTHLSPGIYIVTSSSDDKLQGERLIVK